MKDELIYELTVKTTDNEARNIIGESIHQYLKGKKDYIKCNIILNIDDDKIIKLWIYNKCKHTVGKIVTIKNIIYNFNHMVVECNEICYLED